MGGVPSERSQLVYPDQNPKPLNPIRAADL